MDTSTNRNNTIDVMRGITILLVILGHFKTIPQINHWIFSFHMPLFFILSGYFHKPIFDCQSIQKDVKRLILPYAFVMLILLVYSFAINVIYRYTPYQFLLTLGGTFFPNGTQTANSVPVWFLLALFWCRLSFNLIEKLHNYHSAFRLLIPIAIGCLAIWVKSLLPIELPFSLMEGISALPFFAIGYLYKEYGKPMNGIYPAMMVLIWILLYKYCSVGMIGASYNNFPLAFICACGGTVGVYYASTVIVKIPYFADFLRWAGINSLTILCAHTLERYVAIPYDKMIEMTNVWFVWGVKIAICSLFVVVSYRFRITRYVFNLKSK